MGRVQKGWQFWYGLTCQLGKGRVPQRWCRVDCGCSHASCMGWAGLTDRATVLSALREQGQLFAGGVPMLAPTMASAAEVISPLKQLTWWCCKSWGVKGWQMGLCAVADCCFVACFLIVFWLFFCAFLLTLLFSKMKYPVSNCSQIVIIDCRQMAHSLWSSNHMRETAALSCVYKYWCWSVAVSGGPGWAAFPPAVMIWVSCCVPYARGPHEIPGYL